MKLILILLAGILLSSCDDRSALEFSVKENLSLNEEVSFDSVRRAVFQPHCVSCHKQYDSYAGVKKDLEKIVNSVETDRMPKNKEPLSDVQKSFLKKWVLLGAPEGTGGSPEDDGKLKPTWSSLSTNVFGPKCIQCHNPDGEAKFLNLGSRSEIWKERKTLFNFEDPAASYLLEVLKDPDEPMPPAWSGLPPLNEEEIKVIEKWIEDGIP